MSATIQPMAEVSRRATAALLKELGPVDTIRFLNQFRSGAGDYTRERERLFEGLSVTDIVRGIQSRRPATSAPSEDP